MDIRIVLHAIKSIGLSTGAWVSRYSLYRMWLDRNFQDPRCQDKYISPGTQTAIRPLPSGIELEYEHATASIKFLAENMVRVSWKPGVSPIPYSIAKLDWQPIDIETIHSDAGIQCSSKAIQIKINRGGEISFFSTTGALLRTDLPPLNNGKAWRLATRLRSDEHIAGMGERAAPLNLMGQVLHNWNTDPGGSYGPGKDPLYICTPVYVALGATGTYLVFYENTFPATFEFSQEAQVEFAGGELRYYFIVGSPADLLDRYTQLTGRPELPPRWVFGYHQSRWGYQSEEEIRAIAQGFTEHQLPVSAIHLDIDYMDGYRLFTVDTSRFPNLNKLSDDLNDQGINLVTIIDPAVKKDQGYPVYQSGIQNEVFCKTASNRVLHGVVWPGRAAFPDFSNPVTRLWWGAHYQFFLDANIAGFWHDMNEPVSFSAFGDPTLPISTKHDLDGRGGSHDEVHNIYGFLMNKAGFEALKELSPEKRPWLITRSGWAGLQRYAWNWTGDVASTWEALRQTVITILGLGLSGHVFSGADIGGFSGNPSAELYLRWFQVSTFFPFFRTHSATGTNPREPWSFGEPYTSIVRQYLELRYKLIPYLYTLAREASLTGSPPIRPMFWHYPEWESGWDISDQFLVGEDILVAPILDESSERNVFLPSGEWYDFWSDERILGPREMTLRVPLDQIPVFIRGGTILPMETGGILELHIYPAPNQPGKGALYSDTGEGYGEWRADIFEFSCTDNKIELLWSSKGNYPFSYTNCSLVLHDYKIEKVSIDGADCHNNNQTVTTGQFKKAIIFFRK